MLWHFFRVTRFRPCSGGGSDGGGSGGEGGGRAVAASLLFQTYEKARLAHTIIKKKMMENSVALFFISFLP